MSAVRFRDELRQRSVSLAISLDYPHHKADNCDDKQNRPYPTVSPHPTRAPNATIHHGSVLC